MSTAFTELLLRVLLLRISWCRLPMPEEETYRQGQCECFRKGNRKPYACHPEKFRQYQKKSHNKSKCPQKWDHCRNFSIWQCRKQCRGKNIASGKEKTKGKNSKSCFCNLEYILIIPCEYPCNIFSCKKGKQKYAKRNSQDKGKTDADDFLELLCIFAAVIIAYDRSDAHRKSNIKSCQ